MSVTALTLLFVISFGGLTKDDDGGTCNAPCEQSVTYEYREDGTYECTRTVCPCEGIDFTDCVLVDPNPCFVGNVWIC